MNKAREIVLRLVADGKISVEEAEELLSSIEGSAKPPFTGFFSSGKSDKARERATKVAEARARREKARKRAEATRPKKEKGYGYQRGVGFSFPWDQPDWQWPWDREDWQWPWEKEGWTWGQAGESTSVMTLEEDSQLVINMHGGDLIIRGSGEESRMEVTGLSATSNIAADGKVISVSSAGEDLVMEVPERVISVEVAQHGGDMSVEKLETSLAAQVAGGDIHVSELTGKIQASVEGGDAHLTGIRSEEVEVQANGGDIYLNILPPVEVGSISLSSSSDDVMLILPRDSKCEITANAPNGDVTHSLPAEVAEIIDETDNYLNARLNGGGAEFVISAASGDIAIEV